MLRDRGARLRMPFGLETARFHSARGFAIRPLSVCGFSLFVCNQERQEGKAVSSDDEKDFDDGWTANPEDIPELRELRELAAEKTKARKKERKWKEPWEQ
jgi:hypothetical protein